MAFVIPGMFLLSNQKSFLPFAAFLNDHSDLPIIEELSKDFETGWEAAGKKFDLLRAKYNKSDSTSHFKLNNNSPTAWHRDKVEQKLAARLGKRQVQKQQLFINYIEQYAPLALSEMAQSHVPASITLAQGILETRAGDSRIAKVANNHFGIKCYRKKTFKQDGYINDNDFYHHSLAYDCIQIADDNVWDRFQMYENVALSYRHHSLLLTRESRYNWMIRQYGNKVGENFRVESSWFKSDTVPYYAAWCIGLKKSGYATSKSYAQKLAYLIETYQLWRFDYQLIAGIN